MRNYSLATNPFTQQIPLEHVPCSGSQAWKQSHAQDMRALGSGGMNIPVVAGKGWRTMISQQISKREILDETERTGALRESLSVDEVFEPRSEF